MADIQVTSDARDNWAEGVYQEFRKLHPARTPDPEPDAPHRNNADQPSYYGPGTLPVVSDAPSGTSYTKGAWSWTLKSVSEGALESYGLAGHPIPDAARCGHKMNICQRGDWTHWEFDLGQYRIGHTPDFSRPAHVQSHHTDPIVLQHLDSHPIICQDYHQAQRECERVGKTILR